MLPLEVVTELGTQCQVAIGIPRIACTDVELVGDALTMAVAHIERVEQGRDVQRDVLCVCMYAVDEVVANEVPRYIFYLFQSVVALLNRVVLCLLLLLLLRGSIDLLLVLFQRYRAQLLHQCIVFPVVDGVGQDCVTVKECCDGRLDVVTKKLERRFSGAIDRKRTAFSAPIHLGIYLEANHVVFSLPT